MIKTNVVTGDVKRDVSRLNSAKKSNDMAPNLAEKLRFPPRCADTHIDVVALSKNTLKQFSRVMAALSKGRPVQGGHLNWLEPKDLILINRVQVEATGEPFGILDRGRLEASALRPQNAYYNEGVKDVLSLACLIMVSVINSRAFMDGNKRTGFTAGRAFLVANGYDFDSRLDTIIDADGDPTVVNFLMRVLRDETRLVEFERWLAPFVIPTE